MTWNLVQGENYTGLPILPNAMAWVLTAYFETAKKVCEKYNIKVCDMYEIWQKWHSLGVNITQLLANKSNHPIREIHYYMAIKLMETILLD